MLRDQLPDALLVHGVHDRPQQADRDGFDVEFSDVGQCRDQGLLIECDRDLTLRVDPLDDLERQPPGHVGCRIGMAEVERVELAPLTQHERVRMALRSQESRARRQACQDRVGGLRRPVDEHRRCSEKRLECQLLLGGAVAQRLRDTVEDSLWSRRSFAHPQLAAGVVGDDYVREGPAGVDGDAEAHR